jgi:hypothetical protein
VIRTGGAQRIIERPFDKVEKPSPFAVGTREIPQQVLAEPPMGVGWFWSLRMEQLGRNLAMAGGFEYAYRTGLANREIAEVALTTIRVTRT